MDCEEGMGVSSAWHVSVVVTFVLLRLVFGLIGVTCGLHVVLFDFAYGLTMVVVIILVV